MVNNKKESKRLPRNFHKTFKPERHYMHAFLKFAAAGLKGNYQEISSKTGIPMGKSSGKVPAILDYCRGMGLVRLSESSGNSSTKEPELTPFGRVVLLEDPYLKCDVTQWVAHFNLCHPTSGADVWYQTFFIGAQILGKKFTRKQLQEYLCLVYGLNQKKLIGPMVGMYEEDASFKVCGVLTETQANIVRKAAPIDDELLRGYGVWILQLLKDFFPTQQQVPITELHKTTGWKTIPGWSVSSSLELLSLIEKKGLINVDRHMEPWLVNGCVDVGQAWQNIYMDMI
jgi:hypothetical protein